MYLSCVISYYILIVHVPYYYLILFLTLCYNFYVICFFFLMIRRPPRSTLSSSSAASDVYKRQPSEYPLIIAAVAVLSTISHAILRRADYHQFLWPYVAHCLRGLSDERFARWSTVVTLALHVTVYMPLLLLFSWGIYAIHWSSCELVPTMFVLMLSFLVVGSVWAAREVYWEWHSSKQSRILSLLTYGHIAALVVCALITVNHWTCLLYTSPSPRDS
eukprot:TRINITY_DN9743_c0_g1_i2.p1 TRINITY_DN9743_c0_g1~~TRINITY_DN9743_c0_g1_i2.p1  ORF type:complete len:218 (+),score=40.85 TRINITY_DN9743_c0_g1_i2:18-671(+)